MNPEDKYCGHCGTELTMRELSTFDPKTGKREIGKICRTCHPCDHEFECLPWYKLGDMCCKKCGEVETFYP